jgi:peptide/nickel transport system permease protein
MATIQSSPISPTPGSPAIELTPELTRKRRSQGRIIFDRFLRNKAAVIGFIVLALMVLAAIFAPIIDHNDPDFYHVVLQTAPPSLAYPLGNDNLGRDELARMLYGARVSLLVGVTAMLVQLLIGITVGAVAGFFGGWIDNVLMRITDAFLALPFLISLFVFATLFSDGSVLDIVLLIAIFSWPNAARIVRGEYLSLKQREFLLASRTLGAGDVRLMLRHILPNAIGPITVTATLAVGQNIIAESIISFFGFGLQPPTSSWGTMLNDSQSFIATDPLLVWAPGLAILITVLCFNLIGDGLRDALDPHMTER